MCCNKTAKYSVCDGSERQMAWSSTKLLYSAQPFSAKKHIRKSFFELVRYHFYACLSDRRWRRTHWHVNITREMTAIWRNHDVTRRRLASLKGHPFRRVTWSICGRVTWSEGRWRHRATITWSKPIGGATRRLCVESDQPKDVSRLYVRVKLAPLSECSDISREIVHTYMIFW